MLTKFYRSIFLEILIVFSICYFFRFVYKQATAGDILI